MPKKSSGKSRRKVNQYRRGRAVEHKIRSLLESEGFFVVRSAGSKGVADLVLLRSGVCYLVQIKRSNPRLETEEWNRLWDTAKQFGAVPVIVWSVKKTKPRVKRYYYACQMTGPISKGERFASLTKPFVVEGKHVLPEE